MRTIIFIICILLLGNICIVDLLSVFSQSGVYSLYFDWSIIIALISSIIAVLGVSISLFNNKIRGVSLLEFRKMRKDDVFSIKNTLLLFILIIIIAFILSTIQKQQLELYNKNASIDDLTININAFNFISTFIILGSFSVSLILMIKEISLLIAKENIINKIVVKNIKIYYLDENNCKENTESDDNLIINTIIDDYIIKNRVIFFDNMILNYIKENSNNDQTKLNSNIHEFIGKRFLIFLENFKKNISVDMNFQVINEVSNLKVFQNCLYNMEYLLEWKVSMNSEILNLMCDISIKFNEMINFTKSVDNILCNFLVGGSK